MTKLIRGLNNILPDHQGSVMTMGNFDGVHLGHQALLARVREKAKELKTSSLVVTFEPQPIEYFRGNQASARLTRFREKFFLLSKYGIDTVLVIRFDAKFAALTAEQFVKQVLHDKLKIKSMIVGDDFHFGQNRSGNFTYLKAAGGFSVENTPTVLIENERASSTRVREALAAANHALAQRLLGRPYVMQGRIVHGNKLGRTLGFPTANVYLHRAVTPVQGIYIVRLYGIDKKGLPGVANVGTRPTVGGTRTLLEVHLLDFNQDIYGRYISVEFCEKLRDEEHYPNLELLREQIGRDANAARTYFEMRGEL